MQEERLALIIAILIISVIATTIYFSINLNQLKVKIPHKNTYSFKIEGLHKLENLTTGQVKGHQSFEIKVNTGYASWDMLNEWGEILETTADKRGITIRASHNFKRYQYFSVRLSYEKLKENIDTLKEIVEETNKIMFTDLEAIKSEAQQITF